ERAGGLSLRAADPDSGGPSDEAAVVAHAPSAERGARAAVPVAFARRLSVAALARGSPAGASGEHGSVSGRLGRDERPRDHRMRGLPVGGSGALSRGVRVPGGRPSDDHPHAARRRLEPRLLHQAPRGHCRRRTGRHVRR
ncbi:hypothetical protein H632_c5213p0, partial [Helicosporidium sp. ATCC 50920]